MADLGGADASAAELFDKGRVLNYVVLIALGIGPDGKRPLLGVTSVLSETEVHWRAFLTSCKTRPARGATAGRGQPCRLGRRPHPLATTKLPGKNNCR